MNGRIDAKKVVYLYNGMLFNLKKEGHSVTTEMDFESIVLSHKRNKLVIKKEKKRKQTNNKKTKD
jgi:hypothetical protein